MRISETGKVQRTYLYSHEGQETPHPVFYNWLSESSARVAQYSATLFTTAMIPKPPTNKMDRVSGPNPCNIAKVSGAVSCRMPIQDAAIRNRRITLQRWQLFFADRGRVLLCACGRSTLSGESMGAFIVHTISTSIASPSAFSMFVNLNCNFSLKRKAINCASCSSRAAKTMRSRISSLCIDKSPSGTCRIPT